MGTLGPLLAALEAMPEVLARRIDAAPADDHVWRGLAGAGWSAPGRASLADARLVVRTLGRAAIESDGRPLAAVSPKAVELAAVVARAGAAGAARADVAEALFEGSIDAANYLRQLVHRLRRALPEGAVLSSSQGRLAWLPPDAVVAEDGVLEALLARARREVGDARQATLEAALEMAARGPYLPGAEGDAAAERRLALAARVSEALRERASALLLAGRAARAAEAARDAVAAEPYREDGWRLLMQARAAAEGPASAVGPFLECRDALSEVGLEPSAETVSLLERLRAGAATAR
jgi:DNA-binding SARP family transcriptional activator